MMKQRPTLSSLISLVLIGLAAPAVAAERKPDLYILTATYNEEDTPDAFDFAADEVDKAFRVNASALVGEVKTRMLLGERSTRQSILDSLDWLAQNKAEAFMPGSAGRNTACDPALEITRWVKHLEASAGPGPSRPASANRCHPSFFDLT